MLRQERRQNFRIDDDIYLNYRIVNSNEIYSECISINIDEDQKEQEYLDIMRNFQNIDYKIDFLSLQMLATGAVKMHKVNINICGMAFITKEPIVEQSILKIVLYTKPNMIPVILDATVFYSNYQNDNEYKTVVKFINVTEEQKHLLSQHLLTQQLKRPSNVGITQELNQIKELIMNKQLTGKKLLNEANSIFNSLSNHPHQQTRLNWLAADLANKCYQKCSKGYFAQCSRIIEKTLLHSDWQQASWFRKMTHILSFGYLRIPHNTDVNHIKTNIDFNSEEFKSHVIQLNFLPPSIFNNLGEPQSSNLKEFLFSNLGLELQAPAVCTKNIIDNKIITVN